MKMMTGFGFLLVVSVLVLSSWRCTEAAVTLPPEAKHLVRHYYKKLNTCANVEAFVKHQVQLFWHKDNSITPKFVKLLYSDCMVNGCDASILLDGPDSEKTSPQNAGLSAFDIIDKPSPKNKRLGIFEIIDKIKIVLEIRCPGAVSCADILNLATRDALFLAGAPSYPVLLGRKDGFESRRSWVDLPSPSISWEESLRYFESKNLDILDMATLLGAHSMGRAHCQYFRDRLYNFNNSGKPDPAISKSFLHRLRKQCPPQLKSGSSDPIVFLTPESGSNYKFTNKYYSNVLKGRSVLGVDQQLRYNNVTNVIATEFSKNMEEFRKSFALSMSRMGVLKVLTGKNGEIRRNCRYTNDKFHLLKGK